jgi:hypothetical protein
MLCQLLVVPIATDQNLGEKAPYKIQLKILICIWKIRQNHNFSQFSAFYLPHSEYEGSTFSAEKNEKKIYCLFS